MPYGIRDDAEMRPPWAPMIDRHIESPMPMPSGFRREEEVEDPISYRRIKSRTGILDRHQQPVRFDGFEVIVSIFMRSVTVLVNSTAFMIRFSSTCCN